MWPARERFLGLCLPPLALACLDGGLTLAGQSAAYWAGNYQQVNELSPTFHHLLAWHPAAFALGICVWMLLFTSLILLLPQTLALAVSLAATMGHMVGSATWLLYRFQFGYQACNGLFVLTALLLAVCIRWGWVAEPRGDAVLAARWPTSLRWAIAAALAAAAVYLFLWPRSV